MTSLYHCVTGTNQDAPCYQDLSFDKSPVEREVNLSIKGASRSMNAVMPPQKRPQIQLISISDYEDAEVNNQILVSLIPPRVLVSYHLNL